ncbi:alpha-amylase family glycosyl hydrolase [Lactococcus nasutitermitis]|uniref:Alpha-amylase family glycosyl hydrolase n=1 Tax=Lactococcus nasutitermitis TaxID=1652957 RepID=A0ABV9JCD5_9LACT|nr:alpha-amylase family glycosyl hydrolase [Lactococcus nasutitermitis]
MKIKKLLLVTTLTAASLLTLSACGQAKKVSSAKKTTAAIVKKVNPELYRNFYEIFTGSFADSNGDGEGDLNGVTEHLDYLNTGNPKSTTDLKVQGLWMTPIFASPTYHGYDVTNYEKINPKMGTMADFENLVAQTKKRGIAVILDMPFNHTATNNAWFLKALAGDKKYMAYYNWSDKAKQGYNLASNGKYYESEFDKSMPDLNLSNPDVKAEIAKITQFWLDKGVAGFRLDGMAYYYGTSVDNKTVKFASWLMKTIKSQDKNAYVVGEDYASDVDISTLYGSKIDSLFAFPNALTNNNAPLVNALMYSEGREFAEGQAAWDKEIHGVNPTAIDAPFLTNHDMDRAINFTNTLAESKMAASSYLLLPGNPFIYYGEELGMSGGGIDQNKRLPMQWTANGQDSPKTSICVPGATETATTLGGSVAQQESAPNSLLNWYKKVLRVKAKYPEIASSRVKAVATSKDNLSVMNYGKSLTVVNNFSSTATTTVKLPKAVVGKVMADGLYIDGGQATVVDGKLKMPPYSTVILKK